MNNRYIAAINNHKVVIAIIVLAITILFVMSRFSMVEISINEGFQEGESVSILLVNQDSGDTKTIRSGSEVVKVVVKQGDYEVYASQQGKSAFKIVKTKGFFRTTNVSLNINEENSRSFVGYNPNACSFYTGEYAFSYGCLSTSGSIEIHEPQRGRQATFNSKYPFEFEGSIQGVINNDGMSVLFVRENTIDYTGHKFIVLDKKLKPVEEIIVYGLPIDEFYQIVQIDNQFILYSSSSNNNYRLSSLNSKPEKISTPTIVGSGFTHAHISFGRNGDIGSFYSNSSVDTDEQNDKFIENTLVISKQNEDVVFEIDARSFSDFELCGSNHICLVYEGNLEVYEIDGDELEYKYMLSGVNSLENISGESFVINDIGIISLDVEAQSGSVLYSFGKYSYCGRKHSSESRYLVCLHDNNKKALLAIDADKQSGSTDDKKVFELSTLDEVKSLSVYKNSIIIVPDKGEVDYIESIDQFGFNPEKTKQSAGVINNKFKELDFDNMNLILL